MTAPANGASRGVGVASLIIPAEACATLPTLGKIEQRTQSETPAIGGEELDSNDDTGPSAGLFVFGTKARWSHGALRLK